MAAKEPTANAVIAEKNLLFLSLPNSSQYNCEFQQPVWGKNKNPEQFPALHTVAACHPALPDMFTERNINIF